MTTGAQQRRTRAAVRSVRSRRDPNNIVAAVRAIYDFGFRDLRLVNEFPVQPQSDGTEYSPLNWRWFGINPEMVREFSGSPLPRKEKFASSSCRNLFARKATLTIHTSRFGAFSKPGCSTRSSANLARAF